MLPSSHHTTGHYSHLDREGVRIFDEEGLYSEALAERCSRSGGERSGGERSGGERSGWKGRETPKKRKVDHIHDTTPL